MTGALPHEDLPDGPAAPWGAPALEPPRQARPRLRFLSRIGSIVLTLLDQWSDGAIRERYKKWGKSLCIYILYIDFKDIYCRRFMAGLVSAQEMRQQLEVAKEMLTSELISQADYDGMKEVLLTRFKGDVAPQQQQQQRASPYLLQIAKGACAPDLIPTELLAPLVASEEQPPCAAEPGSEPDSDEAEVFQAEEGDVEVRKQESSDQARTFRRSDCMRESSPLKVVLCRDCSLGISCSSSPSSQSCSASICIQEKKTEGKRMAPSCMTRGTICVKARMHSSSNLALPQSLIVNNKFICRRQAQQ